MTQAPTDSGHDERMDERIRAFFSAVPTLEWETDLEGSARIAETLLRRLVADKALFRALLEKIPARAEFWLKCEEDISEDKLVLWDDMDKGLRIRLRMSTRSQERLAHTHRFSFTNLVLRGSYIHWMYSPLGSFNETTRLEDVREVMMHRDREGDCFTIHHDALHSTPFTTPHTISLVLRGNPVKERAPVMFKEARGRAEALARTAGTDVEPELALAGDMFWRVGEVSESAQRRQERQMSRERFDYWLAKLAEYELI